MDDNAQIRSLIAPWVNACLARDWDALFEICTEDVIFDPPGAPRVKGPDVRTFLDGFPVMSEFDFNFDHIQIDGDIAIAHGNGTMTVDLDGENTASSFKFADHFRRGEDGVWRYSSVIWNDNE